MTDEERIALLQTAEDHRFDEDENADFIAPSDDPIVRAASRLINIHGSYSEIMVTPTDLVLALREVWDEWHQ